MTPTSPRPLRVLMTKAGLDAHERGVHVVSHGLRDHGMEVIVLGLRQSPEAVVRVAIQEDADVIGVSSLAGGHLPYLRALTEKIREMGADSIVVVGGVIPAADVPQLHDMGVAAVFPSGSLVSEIAAKLNDLCENTPSLSATNTLGAILESRLSPPAPGASTPNRPLDGVTVLDLSWHLAGPFCTMILADLGARVIKVESPGSEGGYDPGGIIRHRYHGTDLHYISVNRSKESLTLDLKSADGLADFCRLVAKSDVVFNNFRPGVMERLKLDYETLQRYNPALIYASISSFGATGPERLRPGVDLVLQAMSGGMSMTGYPGERPARAGIPIADLAGSLWAAIAILSAIIRRANGFAGPQLIDTSLLDGQIALFPYFAAYYLNGGFLAGPQGSGGHSPTYGAYQCGDGRYLVIAVIDQKPWELLCAALERPDLLTEERFGSAALRIEHTDDLREILEAHFRTHDRAYFLDRLSTAGIPSGPVNNLAEALAEPQVLARDMVIQVPFGPDGEVGLTGTPVKLSGFSPDYRSSPTRGLDSEAICEEFGLVWRPAS